MADGTAENVGRAVVTDRRGQLTQPQVIKFEFDGSGSASFDTTKPYVVQQKSDKHTLYVETHSENGQDIADAYLTDTVVEQVLVKASMADYWLIEGGPAAFAFMAPQRHTRAR